MAKNKTTEKEISVLDFINTFTEKEAKRNDAFELIKIMQNVTGFEPKMWDQVLWVLEAIITNMTADMKVMHLWQDSRQEKLLFLYTFIYLLKTEKNYFLNSGNIKPEKDVFTLKN